MGQMMQPDPLMDRLIEIALARRSGLGPGPSLKHDGVYRRCVAQFFGITEQEAVNAGVLPWVANVDVRSRKPRGVIKSMRLASGVED